MKCPEVQIIAEYAGGELTNGDHRQVESHLATCPTCSSILEREIQLTNLLRAQTLLKAPPQLHLQVMQSLEQQQTQRTVPEWLWALGLGIVVVIVGLVLGAWVNPHLDGLKVWANEYILQTSLWKSVTNPQAWSPSSWLTHFPGSASILMMNLAIGGIILCWGLWQMIKALRR